MKKENGKDKIINAVVYVVIGCVFSFGVLVGMAYMGYDAVKNNAMTYKDGKWEWCSMLTRNAVQEQAEESTKQLKPKHSKKVQNSDGIPLIEPGR